jgi:hypothetical protein
MKGDDMDKSQNQESGAENVGVSKAERPVGKAPGLWKEGSQVDARARQRDPWLDGVVVGFSGVGVWISLVEDGGYGGQVFVTDVDYGVLWRSKGESSGEAEKGAASEAKPEGKGEAAEAKPEGKGEGEGAGEKPAPRARRTRKARAQLPDKPAWLPDIGALVIVVTESDGVVKSPVLKHDFDSKREGEWVFTVERWGDASPRFRQKDMGRVWFMSLDPEWTGVKVGSGRAGVNPALRQTFGKGERRHLVAMDDDQAGGEREQRFARGRQIAERILRLHTDMVADYFDALWLALAEDSDLDPVTVAACRSVLDDERRLRGWNV